MLPSNAYVIRDATADDHDELVQLAELDGQRPIYGPALIGEIGGRAAAAISLADGRTIGNPFQRTAELVTVLRLRIDARDAYERTPSLRERVRAAVSPRPVARPVGA